MITYDTLKEVKDRLTRLEVRMSVVEAILCRTDEAAAEGIDSVITYVDLQQTDDIKENR